MSGPYELLLRRVRELERGFPTARDVTGDIDSLVTYVSSVLSYYTSSVMKYEEDETATVSPSDADAIVAASRVLRLIDELQPSLVSGPLDRNRQRWTQTGQHLTRHAGRVSPPSAPAFSAPKLATKRVVAVKPQGVGLYTSTATASGRSMWRAFVESYDGGLPFPLPWYTWAMEPDHEGVSVFEIRDAASWVAFIEMFGCEREGLIYPDWQAVARQHDAAHITIAAVAATQGVRFRGRAGIAAAPYWDVETTFWLRWRFSNTALVEKVDGDESLTGLSTTLLGSLILAVAVK